MNVRRARADDADAVAAFTSDTWSDRFDDGGDYVPDVFEEWVETDGPAQQTVVADAADVDDTEADAAIAGLCQVVLLSDHEAWTQGMRVNPDFRGEGVARALNDACFDWAAERGASVCRNMVFSWNEQGLGTSRAVGYEPCTEFRWAHVAPDADAAMPAGFSVADDAAAAWSAFQRSDAREHLRGLALDIDESWALSEATRERFERASDEAAVLAVRDGNGTRASAFRARGFEREEDDGAESTPVQWTEYGVGAWHSLDAGRALFAAIARDAASAGADRTRVLIPETVRYVSDAVRAGAEVSDHPDFVLEADLTAEA